MIINHGLKKIIDMLIELNYPSPILPKQLKKDIIKEWSSTKDIKKYYKNVCDSAITITFKDSIYSTINIIDITYYYNLYGYDAIRNIRKKKHKKTTRV